TYEPAVVVEINTSILKATLVISKQDQRAVGQTLIVQRGTDRREYRYTEASYQTFSPRAVSPSVFEPERELLGNPVVEVKKSADDQAITTASPESEPGAPTTESPASAPATADPEVEAL